MTISDNAVLKAVPDEAVHECPACGGAHDSARLPIADSPPDQTPYLTGIRDVGVDADIIRTYTCVDCGSHYRRPWPSNSQWHAVYRDVVPNHPAGQKLTRQAGILHHGSVVFQDFLERHVGAIESYGEFGCPGWGLLRRLCRVRVRVFGGLLELAADDRFFTVSANELATVRSLPFRIARGALGVSLRCPPNTLYFVRSPETVFWGKNCKMNGVNCATRILADCGVSTNVSKIDLGETPKDGPMDVLSAIQIVDHYPNPVEALREMGKSARHVFIWTHGLEHSPRCVQHSINFSHEGLRRAGERANLSFVAGYRMRHPVDDYGMLFRSNNF